MVRRRNVETLRGIGRFLKDNAADVLVKKVSYVVIVQQEVLDDPTATGALSARGYLVHDHFNPDVVASLVGKHVDLELSDGRRWPCLVQDSDGSLLGRDGFKPPLPPEQRAAG